LVVYKGNIANKLQHQTGFITVRDVKLFTRIFGEGYPIVMMHGGPGIDHSVLLPLQGLGATYKVIYYDHRCNGRSTGANVTSMTWQNLIADADAFRQRLGFEKWAVFGHSFGGMVALEYALAFPQHVSHLILADTCADSRWVQQKAPEALAKRGYSKQTVVASQRFFNGQIKPYEVMLCMLRFGRAYTHHLSLLHSLSLLGVRVRADATIFGFGTLFRNWNVLERLSELTMPTLIIAGAYDFQFPPEHQQQIAERISNAHLKIIENAGHNAPMEYPDKVVAIIATFIGANSLSISR
jgi:proline iminopeptidase